MHRPGISQPLHDGCLLNEKCRHSSKPPRACPARLEGRPPGEAPDPVSATAAVHSMSGVCIPKYVGQFNY
eukprot:1839401-Amphidinium_carterae.1